MVAEPQPQIVWPTPQAEGGNPLANQSWSQILLENLAEQDPATGKFDTTSAILDWIPALAFDIPLAIVADFSLVKGTEQTVGKTFAAASGGANVIGLTGLANDTVFNLFSAGAAGSGNEGTLVKGLVQFAASSAGATTAYALGELAVVSTFGLVGYAGVALAGYFVAAVVKTSYQYIEAHYGQAADNYFANQFLFGQQVATQIGDLMKSAEHALASPANAVKNGALETIENAIKSLQYSYKSTVLTEFNSFENTSNVLQGLARGDGGAGSPLGIAEEAAAIQVYYVDRSLVQDYVANNTVLTNLLNSVMSADHVAEADAAILASNPYNQAAINGLYTAEGSIQQAVLQATTSLAEIDQTTSLGDLTSASFASTTSSPATNGTITGTTGGDILIGTTGADIFDGKGGGDVEVGGGGADAFIFNSGYGSLFVSEDDPSLTSSAKLELGSGISESTVKVTADAAGDIILTIGTAGDVVDLDREAVSAQFGVATVAFSDGTTWTRAQLLQLAATPTTSSDTLYGTSASQTFNGLGGNDTIVGGGGGDAFDFNAGYGTLDVIERDSSSTPTNVLQFGTGILPANVVATADAGGDLILTLSSSGTATGDVVTLNGELLNNSYGVQEVAFSNGTTWTHAQLLQYGATPTSGADNLYLSAPQAIDGLGGGDTITGSGGADDFIYNAGYGTLDIQETAPNAAATTATLSVSGENLSSLVVTGDASNDLILSFSATDVVTLSNELDNSSYGVAEVVSGSTTLTRAQLIALEEKGAAVYGTSGADTFTLQAGETVTGQGGGDVFNYSSGSGTVVINEQEPNPKLADKLVLTGIASTAATLGIINSASVVLTDGVTGDSITLTNEDSDATQGVSSITFSNGVTWTRSEVVAVASGTLTQSGTGTLTGGAGYNNITATGSNTTINSAGLFDTITATHGQATISLLAASGVVTHDASIKLGGMGNTVTESVAGNVTITGVANSDKISLGAGNSKITGSGSSNTISVGSGNSSITLGTASSVSSNNTLTIASGGTVSLTGNSNLVNLGVSGVTDATQNGTTHATVSGLNNSFVVQPSYSDVLADTSTSSATTFTLTGALGSSLTANGSGDIAFVSGGSAALTDAAQGTAINIAAEASVTINGFTSDNSGLLSILSSEGYSSVSAFLNAAVSDGDGGSFIALGTGGGGIDFAGVTTSQLQSFAASGTHFAVVSQFSNGWH